MIRVFRHPNNEKKVVITYIKYNGNITILLEVDFLNFFSALNYMKEVDLIISCLEKFNPISSSKTAIAFSVDDINAATYGRSCIELTPCGENVNIRLIRSFEYDSIVSFDQLIKNFIY
jgi:hypothetical protein